MFAISPGESTRVRWVETVLLWCAVDWPPARMLPSSPPSGRVRVTTWRSYSPSVVEIASSVRVSAIPGRISLVPNRVRNPSALAPSLAGLREVLERGEQEEALAAAFGGDLR